MVWSRRLAWPLLVVVALFGPEVRAADTCTRCLQQCEQAVAIPCAEEASETAEFIGCLAARQSCRTRCACPAPEKVKACQADARQHAAARDRACRVQFSTNPTGCLDKTKGMLSSALASCAK